MSQIFSYKDALMKNPDKSFEISKKVNILEYSRKDIRKLCITGNIEQLKMIPLKQFTEEIKNILLKNIKEKILEIEMWKYEDHNQLYGKLEEFDLRISRMEICYKYIESIESII
jgi:hypothetical protein